MKHIKYIFLFTLFQSLFFSTHAQTLHIEAESINLSEGSQLFIEGTLQATNNGSILSENETAMGMIFNS